LVVIALVLLQTKPGVPSGGTMLARFSADRTVEAIQLEQLPSLPIDPVIAMEDDVTARLQPTTMPPSVTSIQVESPIASVQAATTQEPGLAVSLSATGASEATLYPLPSRGLHARDPQSRTELGKMYGATPESEEAVEAALRWLAAHQRRDGSWSFDLSQEPCNGRCGNPKESSPFPRPATAATGLALLAFLGAGYTHHEGTYAEHVRRGLYFLREEARPSQSGLDLQGGSMYGHGIAMLAIGEAMGMTRYQGKTDSDLFSLATGGAAFTMNAQHVQGGWRYVPGSPGDMTVSAWQILSLISAQHGGVVLRTSTLPKAERFVQSLAKSGTYHFGYVSPDPEPTTTAVGLCLLMYLGQSPKYPLFASSLDQMVKAGPRKNDVYHGYYATLALHHARHPKWASWHVPIRDHLVATQEKEGHEAGSWHFPDRHGDVGGRLYTTAMAAMILEVYYRYLPLYQTNDEFKL
jgi:hypothetical protein